MPFQEIAIILSNTDHARVISQKKDVLRNDNPLIWKLGLSEKFNYFSIILGKTRIEFKSLMRKFHSLHAFFSLIWLCNSRELCDLEADNRYFDICIEWKAISEAK